MNNIKPQVTLDELEAEFKALEHEWRICQNFNDPATVQMMNQAMKLCRDVLNRVDQVPDDTDFEELRKELKHRISQVIDDEVQ